MLTTESLRLSGRASERKIQRSKVQFLSEFFLCPMLMTRKKHLSLFLHRAQNLPSFLFYIQNITSTLLILAIWRMRVMYKLCNVPCSLESLWLSGWALERVIRRSEVWFLMWTQNFSFVHACDKMKRWKTSFSTSL